MTFDDGPNPETTPRLLQILRERNIKVTFFVLGNMVAKHPEVLKMIADEGHEIGSHSWSHPQLTRISQAAVDKELGNTSEAIFQVTGKRPIYLRPPYGSMKPTLRSYIEDKYGLTIVNWSVDPNDWKNRNSQAVHDAIMAQVKPGAIVLSHDIYATTVDAMPRILDELAAKGYKFATLSQMVAMDKPLKVALAAPGATAAKKPKPNGAKPDAAKPAGTSKAGRCRAEAGRVLGPGPQRRRLLTQQASSPQTALRSPGRRFSFRGRSVLTRVGMTAVRVVVVVMGIRRGKGEAEGLHQVVHLRRRQIARIEATQQQIELRRLFQFLGGEDSRLQRVSRNHRTVIGQEH